MHSACDSHHQKVEQRMYSGRTDGEVSRGEDSRKTSLCDCALTRFLQARNITVIILSSAPGLAREQDSSHNYSIKQRSTAAITSVDRLDHCHIFLSAQ
jgi:hypothetical protein